MTSDPSDSCLTIIVERPIFLQCANDDEAGQRLQPWYGMNHCCCVNCTIRKRPLLRGSRAGVMHDFGPSYDFDLDEIPQLVNGWAVDRNEPELMNSLLDFGQGCDAPEFGVQLVDDRSRSCPRSDDHVP